VALGFCRECHRSGPKASARLAISPNEKDGWIGTYH
jgi:hypothetical protein